MQPYRFTIPMENQGKRLDVLLAETLPLTRSAAQSLIENGDVLINGKSVAKNYRLRGGEDVEVQIPDAAPYDDRTNKNS